MSTLDNAIRSINTAADRTTKTTEFVDQLSTYDDISDVTNPNTGETVPSLQKKTRLVAEAAFAESETQINQAVSGAELAALAARSAANYDTEFVAGVTTAVKGKSYLYNGSMWACLSGTSSAPLEGNDNWYSLNNHSSLTNRDQSGAHPASAIDGVVEVFDTVADMKAATWLQAGQLVRTKGYYTAGDGGYATYLIQTTGEYIDVPDGRGDIILDNSLVAKLQVGSSVLLENFGVVQGEDVAEALQYVDAYCQKTGKVLTAASKSVLLASPVTLRAPYINMTNTVINIANTLNTQYAVTYQGMQNNLEHSSEVKIRFSGDRASRSQPITAYRLRGAPSADNTHIIIGRDCNTLCNIDGNVERGEIHVKGNNVDLIVEETGVSPDTNNIYIYGGNYKQAYRKLSSTTSNVKFACQGQDVTATVYPVEILGRRATTLSGEIRGTSHGAVLVDVVDGLSGDFIAFDQLHVQIPGGTVDTIALEDVAMATGTVTVSYANEADRVVYLGKLLATNLNLNILNAGTSGEHVTFGDVEKNHAPEGVVTVSDAGAVATATGARFHKVGDLSVKMLGSALPIVVESTVANDVLNMDVEKSYIGGSIPIITNDVRVNCSVRGMFLTPQVLAYPYPFRGLNLMNVNTNGRVFHNGATWQQYTSSNLV